MLTLREYDLRSADGRTLHYYSTEPGAYSTEPGAYDTASDAEAAPAPRLAVFWSHGTPNTGEPPAPLFAAAEALGVRLFGYDRPGYGPSTRAPGRSVADGAADLAAVADALGIGAFALFGHSGGGPHVLAAAALLPERVKAVVSMSSLAPYEAAASGLDYFAGMHPNGAAELRASAKGREALEKQFAAGEFDPEIFTPRDHAAFEGEWGWIGRIAGKAMKSGIGPAVDDDLAFVAPWGAPLDGIGSRVLIAHGDEDRMVPVAHAHWLAARLPTAELRIAPGDGHVSVLASTAVAALEWLVDAAGDGAPTAADA